MSDSHDHDLGMDRKISRRNFLSGSAVAIGATLLPFGSVLGNAAGPEPQNQAGYDPPVTAGLRGSHPGSFEVAHSLRDGTFWENAPAPQKLSEQYDLIIVGAGISGLAAAHFYREHAG